MSHNSGKRVDYWITPSKIYDAHLHTFSYQGIERRAKAQGFNSVEELMTTWQNRAKLNWELPPKDMQAFVGKWAQELDKYGVEKALIMPDWNDHGFLEIASKEYPDRFIPFMMLNPKEENAMDLLEEGISKHDIRGFKLYPPLHYYHAYEEFLLPFYEKAEEHQLMITYHMGISIGGAADIRYMNPADVSPIARDFKKVNFAFAHFATGYLKELLFLMYHVDNVYAETSSSNRWMDYLPYDITLQQVFQKVINASGTDHIIFGTDSSSFPRGWREPLYNWQLGVLNEIGCTQEDIDNIFWRNLSRLAKL